MREIVYQFFDQNEEINLFTTSREERDEFLNSDRNFDFVGSSYLGADPANSDSQPVFELFNESAGEYFYTISATERDDLLNDANFADRGEAFFSFRDAGADRTPVYRFQNTVTGINTFTPSESERRRLRTDPNFQGLGVAFYTIPIVSEGDTPPSEDPVVEVGTGSISGLVFSDRNRSGVRDSALVQGENPDLIFTLDVSGSTNLSFEGRPVGDVNGDGREDTILDAELAGLIGLNQQLQQQGLGDKVDISIVVFGSNSVQVNMIPGSESDLDAEIDSEEFQFTITPNTDSNNDGVSDVVEILSSITSGAFGAGAGTNFRNALAASAATINSVETSPTEGNIVFLSDGDAFITADDEALIDLRDNNINLSAFGVGEGSNLASLRVIDPLAQVFTSTDEFLAIIGVDENDDLSQSRLESPREGVQVYIDSNNNGTLDADELVTETDADGRYEFTDLLPGSYVIRQVLEEFVQTFPAAGEYMIELADGEAEADIDFSTAPIFRDDFTGAELQVQAFSPDLNTPTTTPITATVGDGVEFDDLPARAVADADVADINDADVADINIDVSSNRIIFTVDETAGAFETGDFSGYRFIDSSNSLESITSVTINPASSLAVSDFRLTFTADLIEINLAGVSYEQSDNLILDVEFASNTPDVN